MPLPAFPAGSYWYGGRHSGLGRPPRWVDQLVQDETEADQTNLEAKRANPEAEGTDSATEESEKWVFMAREDDLEDGLPEILNFEAEAERLSALLATSAGTRRSTWKAS